MGQFHDEMPDWLVDWLLEQHLFFVATAPLAEDGHINLSPKGARARERVAVLELCMDPRLTLCGSALRGTFHVIDSKTVWYEDLTGSGMSGVKGATRWRRGY